MMKDNALFSLNVINEWKGRRGIGVFHRNSGEDFSPELRHLATFRPHNLFINAATHSRFKIRHWLSNLMFLSFILNMPTRGVSMPYDLQYVLS